MRAVAAVLLLLGFSLAVAVGAIRYCSRDSQKPVTVLKLYRKQHPLKSEQPWQEDQYLADYQRANGSTATMFLMPGEYANLHVGQVLPNYLSNP